MTAPERWLPMPDHAGLYEVSSYGQVKSLPRMRSDGKRVRGGIMKLSPDKRGRLEVRLTKDGKGKTRRVHQLVMEAFAGPPEPGQEVRHLDGNPANNRWAPGSTEEETRTAGGNLFYGTHAENMRDMAEHGTSYWGNVTECPAGHEYTEANTVWRDGRRFCHECSLIRSREVYVPVDPRKVCPRCDREFMRPAGQPARKYCSQECADDVNREREREAAREKARRRAA